MKYFQVAKWGVHKNYGKELYLALFLTEEYSLLQVSFDIGDYSRWTELPYFNLSMGQGRLLSVLFTFSKFGISFDFLGRTWNYYEK